MSRIWLTAALVVLMGLTFTVGCKKKELPQPAEDPPVVQSMNIPKTDN